MKMENGNAQKKTSKDAIAAKVETSLLNDDVLCGRHRNGTAQNFQLKDVDSGWGRVGQRSAANDFISLIANIIIERHEKVAHKRA